MCCHPQPPHGPKCRHPGATRCADGTTMRTTSAAAEPSRARTGRTSTRSPGIVPGTATVRPSNSAIPSPSRFTPMMSSSIGRQSHLVTPGWRLVMVLNDKDHQRPQRSITPPGLRRGSRQWPASGRAWRPGGTQPQLSTRGLVPPASRLPRGQAAARRRPRRSLHHCFRHCGLSSVFSVSSVVHIVIATARGAVLVAGLVFLVVSPRTRSKSMNPRSASVWTSRARIRSPTSTPSTPRSSRPSTGGWKTPDPRSLLRCAGDHGVEYPPDLGLEQQRRGRLPHEPLDLVASSSMSVQCAAIASSCSSGYGTGRPRAAALSGAA